MSTRRSSSLTDQNSGEDGLGKEVLTPVRRSGRQVKRKLTKSESSEQSDTTPTKRKTPRNQTSSRSSEIIKTPTRQSQARQVTPRGKITPANPTTRGKTGKVSTPDSKSREAQKGTTVRGKTALASKHVVKGPPGASKPAVASGEGTAKSPKSNTSAKKGNLSGQASTPVTRQRGNKKLAENDNVKVPCSDGSPGHTEVDVQVTQLDIDIQKSDACDSIVGQTIEEENACLVSEKQVSVSTQISDSGESTDEAQEIIASETSVETGDTNSQQSPMKPLRVSPRKLSKREITVKEGEGTESVGSGSTEVESLRTPEKSPKTPLRQSAHIRETDGNAAADTTFPVQFVVNSNVTVTSPRKTSPLESLSNVSLKQPDSKENTAQDAGPRRKRVASELLHAAEIAHGLLDSRGKARPQLVRVRNRTASQLKPTPEVGQGNWVSILQNNTSHGSPSKKNVAQDSNTVAEKDKEKNAVKALVPTDADAPEEFALEEVSPVNVAREKQADMVFESVTAIIKNSVVSDEKMRDFVLNRLAKLTGVTAVVSPSSHLLLHGSWQSILRARKSLDKHVLALDASNKENSKAQISETVTGPIASEDLDNNGVSEEPVAVSTESLDSVASNVMVETQTSDMEISNLSVEVSSTEPSLTAGRLKGLDRSKLSGSVEVYKDKVHGSLFLCSMCGFTSNDQKNVQDHIQRKHKEKKFKCDLCPSAFAFKRELDRHLTVVHVQEMKYTCELCKKEFTDKRYLATHMKRHSGIRNHQCTICGRKFFERHKLKWHLETHKSAEEKNLPYSCSICSKKFYNRSSLADHQNIHTGARPFECHLCEASFSHRIGLKRHLLVHTDSRPYACTACGKAFKTYKQFEAHDVQHTGLGKNGCQTCGKVFSSQFSLKRHLNVCSKKLVVPETVATIDAAAEDGVAAGNITNENNEAAESESTVFMCGVCDQLFSSLEETAAHAQTHTVGEVKYTTENDQGTVADNLEGYTITLQEASASADDHDSYVYVTNDGSSTDRETAVKLLNAMTTQEEYVIQEGSVQMDDTQLVANTLADLSAIGQSQVVTI